MFEQTFVQTQAQTRRPWTVVVSLSLQCGVVAILFLLPLLRVEKLRLPEPAKLRVIPAWIPPLPVAPPKAFPNTPALSVPVLSSPRIYIPAVPHTDAARGVDIPPVSDSELTPWSGSQSTTFGPMLPGSAPLPPRAPVQPAAAPVTPKAPAGPVKVGGEVESAKLVFGPRPPYPAIAISARSQGTVRLEAIIAANGAIRNLRIISGPPLLVNAAVDAVRQWRYQPTLLNGVAVEVVTEIEVNFTLGK